MKEATPASIHVVRLIPVLVVFIVAGSASAQNGRYVYAGGIYNPDPGLDQGGRIYSVDTETGTATLATTSTLVSTTINSLAANPDDGLAYYGSGSSLYAWNRDTDTHSLVADLSALGVPGQFQSGGGTYWNGSYYLAPETDFDGVTGGAGRGIDVWKIDFTPGSGGMTVAAATRVEVAAASGFDTLGDFGDLVAYGDTLHGSSNDFSSSYTGAAAGETAANGYWTFGLGSGVFNAVASSLAGRELAVDGDGRLFATNGSSGESGGSQIIRIDAATGDAIGSAMEVGFAPADLSGAWDSDSQVRFNSVNGAIGNGGSDTVNLGSVFVGGSFVPTTITAVKSGSQATTYTLSTGGSASLPSVPSLLFGEGTTQPGQAISATLTGTGVLGSLAGSVVNDNQDSYSIDATESLADNQYGAIDPNDTVNLLGAVYAHSNASFSLSSDQNTGAALDFGDFTDSSQPVPQLARTLFNLPGTDVPGGNGTPDPSATGIAFTVALGYTSGLAGADAASFTLPGGGGTLAPNTGDDVNVAFNPGDPSVNRLGTYTATVDLTVEDTGLNAAGFSGPDTGANANDTVNPNFEVSATVRDSQVTFANVTDTSGGGSVVLTGQLLNGAAQAHDFGNVWRGQALSASGDVNLTGNEDTGYGITQTAGNATLGGDLSAAPGSLPGDSGTPSAIRTAGQFTVALGTADPGTVESTLLLENADSLSPNAAIAALDLANGTGAGFGEGDSADSLTLAAAVYGHSNASFVDLAATLIPTENVAGDFDPANDDIDYWSIDFGTWNRNGSLYLGGGDTGGSDSALFGIGNLPVVDSFDGGDNGLAYTVQMTVSSVTNDAPLLDGVAFALGDTSAVDGIDADAIATLIAVSWNPGALANGNYVVTYTFTPQDDRAFDPLRPGANADALGLGIDPADPAGGGEALELTLSGTVVPEPSGALLLLAAGGLAARRRVRAEMA